MKPREKAIIAIEIIKNFCFHIWHRQTITVCEHATNISQKTTLLGDNTITRAIANAHRPTSYLY